MEQGLGDYLSEFARIHGMRIRVVPRKQAQKDKIVQRRKDIKDIALGKFTPSEITLRNSGGLGKNMVVKDKSASYR